MQLVSQFEHIIRPTSLISDDKYVNENFNFSLKFGKKLNKDDP